MVVFDITNRETFTSVSNWMNEIEKLSTPNVCKILVGNKTDLSVQRQVTYAEGAAMAKKYGIKYLESSAKKSDNVTEVFQAMAKEMLNRALKKLPTTTPNYSSIHSSSGYTIKILTL